MKWSESHSVVSDSLWPHGLYSPWNSPGQNTAVGSRSLLQRIFPTQGSNPGRIVGGLFTSWDTRETQEYWSGKAKNTGVGSPSFLQRIFPTQESNRGLLHCRQILYHLSYHDGEQLSPCTAKYWAPELCSQQRFCVLQLRSDADKK